MVFNFSLQHSIILADDATFLLSETELSFDSFRDDMLYHHKSAISKDNTYLKEISIHFSSNSQNILFQLFNISERWVWPFPIFPILKVYLTI